MEFGTLSVGGRRLLAGIAFGAMFEDVGIPDAEKESSQRGMAWSRLYGPDPKRTKHREAPGKLVLRRKKLVWRLRFVAPVYCQKGWIRGVVISNSPAMVDAQNRAFTPSRMPMPRRMNTILAVS